ncbi:hypothetical protein [Planotetraspora mira]|uniref:Uncharacterized protein n=1 Tax=Planotetraspora mira TaxID=58121 RepID=A0A8J3X7E6_9ACTN|nr:hypothetical protein [Planotetraspora mira]GII26598.1 hypothetical protein Pmi06nite_00400 [Planotetraspora mira]
MTKSEHVRYGEMMTGDVQLSGQPGDETEDRTSRLVIESYQMAYKSRFGEGIRLMLMDAAAKNMVAWYDGFSDPAHPAPVAWVGAHHSTHIPDVIHQHWSIETSLANGQLHTRFSIDYGTDLAQVLFNRSDVLFSASEGGKFRIGISPDKQKVIPRDFVFGTGGLGADSERRWVLRCDTAPETGGDRGSHLRLLRYSDEGRLIDAPISVHRNNGHVGMGTEDTGVARVTVKHEITALRLIGSASSTTSGLLRLEPSHPSGVAVDIRPDGATVSPFTVNGNGRLRTTDDVEVADPARGVVLTSPNGSRWRVTVDDAGRLQTKPA